MDEAAFGRYRLIALIGEGGMGKVYRAHDTVIGRDVALKLLPAELAAEPGYRERFRREAQTAARLTEPHIIPIHDTGEIDGRLYLVMPIIEGVDVAALLQRDGPMSPQRAVHITEQLAAALDAAHAAGLVHRDVKPSNALVTGRDFVYLIDFGIARDAAAPRLTSTGMIVGTLAYMAPERFTAGSADARADIYALACVLHECLTGHQPYPGDSMEQQLTGHLTLDPPRPSESRPDLPVGFDEVIATGMAKDPDRRYQSAQQLAAAARRAQTTRPSRTPRSGQPAVSPRRSVDRPPVGIGAPPVRPRRRRPLKWQLIAAAVVILAAAGITGYLVRPPSSTHQISTAPTPSTSGQSVLSFSGLNDPMGVAVDGAGDVYVVERGRNRVLKLAAGSTTPAVLPFTGLDNPAGLAVDAALSVYVTNWGNNTVLKLAANSSSTTELSPFTGNIYNPQGVALDGADTLYVAAGGNASSTKGNRVLKLAAGSASPIVLPFTGVSSPRGVAVDGAGAVYVTSSGDHRVLKLAADAAVPTELPFPGLNAPGGVAVDGAGDVYVVDTGGGRVLKLAAGSSAPTVLPLTGLSEPTYVAVDAAGTVYVTDAGNNRVVALATR